MEWNALTYSGNTVWNVRNEKSPDGGYIGGEKRKPRSEWMIQENTHEALIEPHAVTSQLISDMTSREFVCALTREVRKYSESHQDDPAKNLRKEVLALNDRISKTMGLIVELDNPSPAIRKINKLENKRK